MNTLDLLKDAIIKYLPFDTINEAKDYVYDYLKMNGVTNIPSKNSVKFKKLIEYLQNELGGLTKGRRKVNLVLNADSLWMKLVKLGYSEGDIVNSDDISEASDELGMDFDEAMDLVDEIEEAYNVTVLSNDMLAGDGPGNYYETDSSADNRMQDDSSEAAEKVWNYLQSLGYSEGDIVSSNDFSAACRKYNLDEDSFGEDDYSGGIETMENLYNIEIFAPDVIEGDGPGEYVYIG